MVVSYYPALRLNWLRMIGQWVECYFKRPHHKVSFCFLNFNTLLARCQCHILMPLPKALQRRNTSSKHVSSGPQRKFCKLCHNLDPRSHLNTVYETESKEPRATLTLVLDAVALSRSKKPNDGGCRFCNVISQALGGFYKSWDKTGQRIYVELQEKGTIKVALDGSSNREEAVELSAASGTSTFPHTS